MTKRTFSNDMAAHVWAAQSQQSGQGSKGSIFFEGPAIYSYGTHFLAGFIIGDSVLLNAESYSVTTSRHQSEVSQASRHLRQYSVPNLTQLREALPARDNPKSREWTQPTVRKWLRDNATRFDENATDYRGNPLTTARFVAALFGLTAANVAAEIKRGNAEAAKSKAERVARDRREAISQAKHWADMSDADFYEWAHRHAHVFEPMTFSYVSQMEKSVAAFAKRLNGAARLGVKVLGKRRVTALQARRKAVLARLNGMAARAIEKDHAAELATFQEWAARWRNAGDDTASKFAAMERAPQSWRYQRETRNDGAARVITEADLAELKAAEQWARDHAEERKAMLAEIAAREAEQRREREAANFAAWLRGDGVQCPSAYRATATGGAYVRRRGDYLETSQGASVPWAHAVKAFRFIKLCRERGEGWHTNGRVVRVGHFQVSEITPAGNMTAGCHKFAWNDIERLARAEGVFDAPASAEAVEERQ